MPFAPPTFLVASFLIRKVKKLLEEILVETEY